MGHDVDLYTPLDPSAIAARLQAIMNDPMADAEERIWGAGDTHNMTLSRERKGIFPYGAHYLKATITPEGSGSRITGAFRSPGWLPGYLVITAGLAVFYGLAIGLPAGPFQAEPAKLLALPVGIIVLYAVLALRGNRRTRDDWPHIQAFLEQEIEARPVEESASTAGAVNRPAPQAFRA
ncbi:hypothetical protein [Blastomonas sp.]|uniref:hypothetical protein n=1 Tax=Blastomonas sp. TaxID=1909299 RepID=UPI0035933123